MRKTQVRLILVCVGIVAAVVGIIVMQSVRADVENIYPTYLYQLRHGVVPIPLAIFYLGWAGIGIGACLIIIGSLKYLIWFFSYLGTLLRRFISFVADLSR